MKRRVLSSALAMLLSASAMMGCATTTVEEAGESTADSDQATEGTSDESSSTTVTGEGEETLHVFLYMQEHEKEIYQKLIDEFVEEHKDQIKEVVFEVTTQDEYNQKMIANMTAGDMPDVFYVGPAAVRSYVDNGYIMALDDYVDEEAISSIWGTTQEIYRYDGTNIGTGSLYAFPKDLSCFAFAYNQDLFDAAGLEYPDPENPYTYEEFVEVCEALTKDTDGDGEIDQWGVANADQFGMTPYLYSNGVKFLNDDMTQVNVANNPQLTEALTFYTDLTKDGLTPSVEQDTALGGYQRWLDGQVGFYACGTWDVAAFMDENTFPYKWNLCGWPVGPSGDGKSHTWMGSVGYCVSATTNYPDLSAQLVAKLSTDVEGQKAVSGITTGASIQLPNIVDLAYGEFKDAVNDGTVPYASNVDVIFGYFDGNDHYEASLQETDYTYNSEWFTPFWSGVFNIKNGDITVEDYLAQVEPEMQAALDEAIELQNSATK
ncbi:MAG: sugar ABC transporter substrate-binding protein [Butyrivibrio sp.]|uniref:ABC transporter substrate-binding protein n=1 Tax=Butyrivibrio sp. TaxID=28121 RepID=UPI0026001BF5|nr:sugar ABC transporter substrate-binding protein [Butyrivibrio sp.]MCR5773235.1 sugar ABC transporter substrate-binding protein [Butyrivibrio sp.]